MSKTRSIFSPHKNNFLEKSSFCTIRFASHKKEKLKKFFKKGSFDNLRCILKLFKSFRTITNDISDLIFESFHLIFNLREKNAVMRFEKR